MNKDISLADSAETESWHGINGDSGGLEQACGREQINSINMY